MAKEYAKKFYNSKDWIDSREKYLTHINGLCERCLKKEEYIPALIVHHKKYITPENIDNPNITLDWNNFEGLCLECHNLEHGIAEKGKVLNDGLMFDFDGNIIKKETG